MIDYGVLLLAPLYQFLGVDAVITFTDPGNSTLELTVIDKTAGVMIGSNIETGTLDVGVIARFSDIDDAGFALEDLNDAEITFSDNTWRVVSYHPKPVPSGEKSGEIVMVLELVS